MSVYDIWFARVDIANSIKLKLLEKFEVQEIWNMKEDELLSFGLKATTVSQILNNDYRVKLEQYEKYLEKNNISFINYKTEDYPWKLRHIPDFPAYIFVKGNKNILDDESVAIIGSRNCTNDGKQIAFNIAKELGDKNVNVISGLAIRNRHFCSSWKLKK